MPALQRHSLAAEFKPLLFGGPQLTGPIGLHCFDLTQVGIEDRLVERFIQRQRMAELLILLHIGLAAAPLRSQAVELLLHQLDIGPTKLLKLLVGQPLFGLALSLLLPELLNLTLHRNQRLFQFMFALCPQRRFLLRKPAWQ